MQLFLCGDVMTGRGIDQILSHPAAPRLYEPYVSDAREYVELAEKKNGPIARSVSPTYVWGDALDELQRRAPLVRIVNLETSITGSDDAWPKGINYRMDPGNASCLDAAHLDVCVLANNHVIDWGLEGLSETLDVLHRIGIRTVGAGRDVREAEELATVKTADGRVLIAAVAHSSSGVPISWRATEGRAGVAVVDELSERDARDLAARITRQKQPGDVCVVSIHWGSNWGYEIPDEHVRFAHALVDGGVDVVHGHSSHHPRALEVRHGKLILYGCGDFINDYEGIAGYESFRADLVLMYLPAFARGELLGVRMVPLRLRRLRLERATKEDARWMGDTLARSCQRFATKIRLVEDGTLFAS